LAFLVVEPCRILMNVTAEADAAPIEAFEFLPALSLMIFHHRKRAPTDAEWDSYLAAMSDAARPDLPRCIIVTEGAHPNRAQQARLIALVKGRPHRVAVISSAVALRFVVSALALVNKAVKAFSPTEYAEAFAHVGVAPREWGNVRAVIEGLRTKVDSTAQATLNAN
jgi:hypothetical protein